MYFVMWHADFSKASLLSERHAFSLYTRQCNFIHAHKNITAFNNVDIQDKNVQRCYYAALSHGLHKYWTIDVRSRERVSSDLESKVWLFISRISIQFKIRYYWCTLVAVSCNQYSPNPLKTEKGQNFI
jgi:hypothetical protein